MFIMKLLWAVVFAVFRPPESETSSYAGYHLAYEVKKLMYASALLNTVCLSSFLTLLLLRHFTFVLLLYLLFFFVTVYITLFWAFCSFSKLPFSFCLHQSVLIWYFIFAILYGLFVTIIIYLFHCLHGYLLSLVKNHCIVIDY